MTTKTQLSPKKTLPDVAEENILPPPEIVMPFTGKDIKRAKHALHTQVKAYDTEYLTEKLENDNLRTHLTPEQSKILANVGDDNFVLTREQLSDFFFDLFMNSKLTEDDITPPFNMMYVIVGNVPRDLVMKERITALPIKIKKALAHYYKTPIDNVANVQFWPTYATLQKATEEVLLIYYRHFEFAIIKDFTTTKQIINKFIENMNALDYKYEIVAAPKAVGGKAIEKVDIFSKKKTTQKIQPKTVVSSEDEEEKVPLRKPKTVVSAEEDEDTDEEEDVIVVPAKNSKLIETKKMTTVLTNSNKNKNIVNKRVQQEDTDEDEEQEVQKRKSVIPKTVVQSKKPTNTVVAKKPITRQLVKDDEEEEEEEEEEIAVSKPVSITRPRTIIKRAPVVVDEEEEEVIPVPTKVSVTRKIVRK